MVVDVTATDQDAEHVEAELVDRPQVPAVPDQPAQAAIEAAAAAALAMPGVPGRDEFLSLAMQARVLSLSGAAPEAVRNNPHVAFHVAMVGRDLGISPSAALQLIDVLKTSSGYQLSLSPQLLNGQIRRLGLGAIRPVVQERDRCVAAAVAPDGTVLGETEFTWEDARDAGLVGAQCKPGDHHKTLQRKRKDGSTYQVCGCNQGYITYPRRMMWWRASGFCANDYFPEAGLGLYSPEELGAVVDDEGRPIDPATVALPAGYDDPKELEQAKQAEQQAQREAPADPVELMQLQLRIAALPDQARSDLAKAWVHPESRLRGVPARAVPHRLLAQAKAMVNAHWGKAKRAGVDMDLQLALVHQELANIVRASLMAFIQWPAAGPQTAQDAPEPSTGPDPAPEAPQATQGDPGGESGDADIEQVDWRPVLRAAAAMVQELITKVPEDVAARISAEVKAMHHTKINGIIAIDAADDIRVPPDAPIDLRRMVVAATWMDQFLTTGEVPTADG